MDITNDISQVLQMSLDEAAVVLGVSRRTIQRRLKEGALTGQKRGGRWLVNVPSIATVDTTGDAPQMQQLSLNAAADLLSVSVRTVQRRLREGTLTGQKRAGRWFVNVPHAPAEDRVAQFSATLSHQSEEVTRERDTLSESLERLARRVEHLETVRGDDTMPPDNRTMVTEAVLATIAAWNGKDAGAYVSSFHPDYSGFFLDGELLGEAINKDVLEIAYDAGYVPNMSIQHLDVKIHDDTAIVTGYFVGTIAYPRDAFAGGTWRYSEVRITHDGQWKILHHHLSPLTPAPGRRIT